MSARRQIHLERLRKEHEARVEAWRKLTPQEQMRELAYRPGESRKQLARIRAKQGA